MATPASNQTRRKTQTRTAAARAASTPKTRAPGGFTGYSKQSLTFLRQIVQHNDRSWFAERKTLYDEVVRGDTLVLVDALNARLERFAPDYVTEPKLAIPRIYRDLRFSADKRPYKHNIAAVFPHHGGERNACASFYVSISAKSVIVVAGVVRPQTPFLAAIRARIAADPKAFARLLRRKALRTLFGDGIAAYLDGPVLVNVPRGIPRDHPAGGHLRHKQYCVRAVLPRRLAGSTDLLPTLSEHFRAAAPFVKWLDESRVDPATSSAGS